MAARFASNFRRYEPAARPFDARRAHSLLRPHQLSARHPSIARREQHRQSRGVLGQSVIPDLGAAQLLFDEAQRVLDLGTDAGLEFPRLLQQLMQLARGIKGTALSRLPGDLKAHRAVVELLALVHALVHWRPCRPRCAPDPIQHPHRCAPLSRSPVDCPSWSGASRDRALRLGSWSNLARQ